MKKKYTFLIIPHKSGKMPIEFNMTKWLISSIGVIAVVFVLVLMGSLYYSAHLTNMSVKYAQLEHKSRKVQARIDEYNRKTEELKDVLLSLQERDQEIRRMLGLRANKNLLPVEFKKKIAKNSDQPTVAIANILSNVKQIQDYTRVQRRSYDNLYSAVVTLRQNFDRTPSIWPLYGYIMSGFGYRMHPILGAVQFHSGVDIPTYVGAPIKAAASGSVISAGWESGYGLNAVIDHHNGLRTIYAHLSRISVRPGETVKKGQFIASAGNTGLSTGPHLHYELRVNNRPVSPTGYLNLDIFKYSVAMNRRSR